MTAQAFAGRLQRVSPWRQSRGTCPRSAAWREAPRLCPVTFGGAGSAPGGGRGWGVCAWPHSASRSRRHLPSEFLDLQTHHAASAFTITSPSPWVQRCPNAPLHKDSGHTGQGPPSNPRTLRARGSIPSGCELVARGGGRSALVSPTGTIAAAGPHPST